MAHLLFGSVSALSSTLFPTEQQQEAVYSKPNLSLNPLYAA